MIPQVGGFQGCYLDNHRNNWRCARAVPALCENAPLHPVNQVAERSHPCHPPPPPKSVSGTNTARQRPVAFENGVSNQGITDTLEFGDRPSTLPLPLPPPPKSRPVLPPRAPCQDKRSPHFVPNMAAESSCYIQFILDRYDTLPQVSVFLQAGGRHHNWNIREWIEDLRPDLEGWVHLNSDPPSAAHTLGGRQITEVHPGIRRLADAWNASGIRIGHDWIANLKKEILRTYCCQQFAVSRATIRRLPREFYQILLDLVTDKRGYEPGWGGAADWGMGKEYWGAIALEHLWHVIWGSEWTLPIYTREMYCQWFQGKGRASPCHPEYRFCKEFVYHMETDCERE